MFKGMVNKVRGWLYRMGLIKGIEKVAEHKGISMNEEMYQPGIPAKFHEWRFLIRVTESDIQEPKKDLRDIIRTQQQGYMTINFCW